MLKELRLFEGVLGLGFGAGAEDELRVIKSMQSFFEHEPIAIAIL